MSSTHVAGHTRTVLSSKNWGGGGGGGGGGWEKGWKGKSNYVTALCDPRSRSGNFSSNSNEILRQVKRLISRPEEHQTWSGLSAVFEPCHELPTESPATLKHLPIIFPFMCVFVVLCVYCCSCLMCIVVVVLCVLL